MSAKDEWRAGWHYVALTAIGLTCAPTTLPVYTIGIFVTPFEAEFGWGRGMIQAAILFSTGLGVICAPLAGWMIRKFGLRWTILPGLLGLAAALCMAAGMSGDIWQLYAVYGAMSLLGAGCGAVGWTCLVAERFSAARGLALGVALSGTGLCAIVMPQVAAWSITEWGWRGAYLALAGVVVALVLPLAATLLPKRSVNAAGDVAAAAIPRDGLDLGEAVRRTRFWILGFSTTCIYLAVGGIIPNLVPALQELGVPATVGASVLGAFGLSIIFGRIAVGALLDHYWAPAVAACVLAPAALACFVFQAPAPLMGYMLGAILLGIATGMEFDVLGFLTARYFGLRDYARIYSRAYIFVAAAAGVAPLIFGYMYDHTGNYDLPLTIGAALLIAGAAGMLALGQYPRSFPAGAAMTAAAH